MEEGNYLDKVNVDHKGSEENDSKNAYIEPQRYILIE